MDAQLRRAVDGTDVISLAGGVPADELFPVAQIKAAFRRSIRADAARVLQYGWADGLGHLRSQISGEMGRRGVHMPCEQILITSGAQQGLSLLARLLLPAGAAVAVEDPTYSAALQAFDLGKPKYRAIPRTASGIDLDALEDALGAGGARVLYLIASGHNPTGGVLSVPEREAVLACAADHDAWVIDDDAYGPLQFGVPEPPLLAIAGPKDRVVHVGSFSKVLAPGLRIGWVAGPASLIRELGRIKESQDLESAGLTQQVLSAWLDENSLADHVQHVLGVYRARRDAMVAALRARLPSDVRWEVPVAGFSLLLQLPPPLDAAALLPLALRAGVGFEPAAPYHVALRSAGVRLSFSNVSEVDIGHAVDRLGGLLARTMSAL